MKSHVVILAAGMGQRLRPLTDDRPKCLVPFAGKPLLEWQLAALRAAGVDRMTLVGGYRADRLAPYGLPLCLNPLFETTNMVETLFCARGLMDDRADLLIAYSDILYKTEVVEKLLAAGDEVNVVVDTRWKDLWLTRMPDPLADAETLRWTTERLLIELGKKPRSYDEIQAQYIGLIKVRADRVKAFVEAYDRLDRRGVYDGRPFPKMFMTSFIQHLIDTRWRVLGVPIDGGWVEFDTLEDIRRYEDMFRTGELKRFWSPQ